jgi:deoxyadenosine/deoxycytidine kinase
MARLIFIGGRTGTGKSTSLMTLDPSTTFILNADAHELPFRYSDKYNEKTGNYSEDSSISGIKKALTYVNDNKHITTMVIDTWSRVMTDYIMDRVFRTAVDGRKAWGKFSQDMYDLLDTINNVLRRDLIVFLNCHTDTYFSESGILLERIAVHGQQLSKFVPESFSTVVLYTQVESIPGQRPKYFFRTETSGYDTCKSPIGMFKEPLIPNDLNLVIKTINEYYN